jgi:hypothetical protein
MRLKSSQASSKGSGGSSKEKERVKGKTRQVKRFVFPGQKTRVLVLV